MNNAKHTATPGPWTWGRNHQGRLAIYAPDMRGEIPIAYVGGNGQDNAIEKGNAALMASAPDLLQALQTLIELVPSEVQKCYPVAMLEARAAIARAEGREA